MVKKVALFTVIILLFSSVASYAYNYPSSFWSVNSKYVTALNTNNYADIIKYGNQEISMFSGTKEDKEKIDIYVTRYKEIAKAYAALGDYNNSAYTYNLLYNYASQYSEYWEYAKSAKAYALQYTPSITVYTDKGSSPYYGAKNEKKNGVLFGICANGETRGKLKDESMVLVYQELGENLLSYNTGVVRDAASKGIAVEFALNCPNMADDINNIKNKSSYLKEISDMFKKYPDTPIYLRFGAEFDIWDKLADAELYKSAFRYVSEYFKSRNSNVAIVWSPAQESNWYVNIDDYYPGDEYVDWVGVSLYAQKYFRGDVNASDADQVVFKCGANSDPVLAIKNIIEKYGNRKPIMLSESGCGHKLVKTGLDTSEFALRRLKEYYSYLPMVYPQIKLIAYFDWYVNAEEEKSDYRLSTNSVLQNEYLKLVKGERFIHNRYDENTDFCYRMVSDNISVDSVFLLSCYAHKYNDELKQVAYFIDGNYVGGSNEIPYTTYIDASAYSGGHILKTVAEFSSGETMTKEENINIYGSNDRVIVKISGEQISFDQNPILYNDRTMVPMRKIFEELGANVSWDNSTQTAIGKKGDRTVRITVGSKKIYVNSKEIALDTPAIILSSRTLVPARAVAEGLGCDVEWDRNTSTVYIEPKVFKWSSWREKLPNDIDEDLYYIEKKTEYRYSEKEYTESDEKYLTGWRLYDSKVTSWGTEQGPVYSDPSGGSRKVRSESYVTSSNYKTIYHYFRYANSLHANWGSSSPDYANLYRWDLDYELQNTSLGPHCFALPCNCGIQDDYHTVYSVDWRLGEEYKTKEWISDNYGTRWYYREPIYTYYFSRWSDWSDWDDEDPYDYFGWNDVIDVEERTVYRYKEK